MMRASIEHPRYYRESEIKLKKVQSKYSKCKQLPRNNPKKIKLKKNLVNLHCKVKNKRKDFLHKLSRRIVKENSVICVEKLNIKGMLEDNWRVLNKSILDGGWYDFRMKLRYKSVEEGSKIIEVDPKNTTATCSNCGIVKHKELGERIHSCQCGLKIGRDVNAAINILRVGMDSLSLNTLNA